MRLQFFYGGFRQFVATIVAFVVGVPFHFHKGYVVFGHLDKQQFPKIDVFHFVFRSSLPARGLPAVYPPFQKRIEAVRRIAVHGDFATFLKLFETLNYGKKLR